MRGLLFGPLPVSEDNLVLKLTIPGKPIPKARARVLKNGHHYTPESTTARQEAVALLASAALKKPGVDADSSFSLRAAFFLNDRRRVDVDNLVKLIADALNGVIWKDDTQVSEIFAYKDEADRPDEARTEIIIARVSSERGSWMKCSRPGCPKRFRVYSAERKFCGNRCSALFNSPARINGRWAKSELPGGKAHGS